MGLGVSTVALRTDEKSFVVKEVSGENASTACFSESALALRGTRALGVQVFLGPWGLCPTAVRLMAG